MAEFLINNTDASTLGVRMGNGFIDSLELPSPLKEPITNVCRLEDGTRSIMSQKKAQRDVTLSFVIIGSSAEDFKAKKSAFLSLITGNTVTINVPFIGSEVYTLTYRSSTEYAHSLTGRMCKLSVKFTEYNPGNR